MSCDSISIGSVRQSEGSIEEKIFISLSKKLNEIVVAAHNELMGIKYDPLQPSTKLDVDPLRYIPGGAPLEVLPRHHSSKGKKRVKTLVIATFTKSFNLPDNWEVSLEKIDHVLQLKVLDPKKQFQFQLADRVEGWEMKRKKRIGGREDTFFYHEKSKNRFRSVEEVLDFFLYEGPPKGKQTGKRQRT
ncbi:hypothetical protein ACFE04_000347 [Oxalis oulophora]